MQLLFTYTWHSHHSPATLLWKIWIQHTGKHVQHTGTITKITLHVFTSWLSGRDHFWLGCEVDIFNSLSILTLLGVHSQLLFFSDWTCLQQKSRCLRILIHPHLYDKDTFISAIIIKKLNHKSITADLINNHVNLFHNTCTRFCHWILYYIGIQIIIRLLYM